MHAFVGGIAWSVALTKVRLSLVTLMMGCALRASSLRSVVSLSVVVVSGSCRYVDSGTRRRLCCLLEDGVRRGLRLFHRLLRLLVWFLGCLLLNGCLGCGLFVRWLLLWWCTRWLWWLIGGIRRLCVFIMFGLFVLDSFALVCLRFVLVVFLILLVCLIVCIRLLRLMLR